MDGERHDARPGAGMRQVGGRAQWDVVRAAQHGDRAAVDALYRHYVGEVYRFVSGRVGSRELAEDLTSATFVRALARLDAVQERGSDFGAWLMTIARNLVFDYYRSAHARLVETTDAVPERVSDEPGVEELALARLRDDTVVQAVQALSQRQRRCIELRFFAGASVREASDALGIPEGAVKSLQQRALGNLRRSLATPATATAAPVAA